MARKTTKKDSARLITLATARTQFGRFIDRAATRGERFMITRYGVPHAILLGMEDFAQATKTTLAAKTLVGQRLAEGLEDIGSSLVQGPFQSADELLNVLDAAGRASKRQGRNKLKMSRIDAEITAYRRGKRKKR